MEIDKVGIDKVGIDEVGIKDLYGMSWPLEVKPHPQELVEN